MTKKIKKHYNVFSVTRLRTFKILSMLQGNNIDHLKLPVKIYESHIDLLIDVSKSIKMGKIVNK
jgi:hypothetical protein